MLTPSELDLLKKGCKEFSKYFDEKWEEGFFTDDSEKKSQLNEFNTRNSI